MATVSEKLSLIRAGSFFSERFSIKNDLCSNISICVHFMLTDIFTVKELAIENNIYTNNELVSIVLIWRQVEVDVI